MKRNLSRVRYPLALIIASAALGSGLVSCSVDLADDSILERATDAVIPSIEIASPAGGSACANLVEVSGRVSDRVNKGTDGKVVNLSYQVPSTSIGEPSVEISGDGSFRFVFDASALLGNFTLSLSATDWNGNVAIQTLPLVRESGNGLPSFAVSAGNNSLNLTWESVPGTAYYLVYHNADGSIPNVDTNPGIRVPSSATSYSIDGCANGTLYYVRLKAVAIAGNSSLSDYEKALPLSSRTLCPSVSPGSDSITLSWAGIPATNRFEIWRRTGTEGEFGLYAESTGNSYSDRNVTKETWYSYKVRPALDGAVLSESEWGMPQWFEKRPRHIGTIETGMRFTGKVKAVGELLFSCASSHYSNVSGFSIVDISDPANPEPCSFLDIPALDVTVSGNLAYVVSGGGYGWAPTYAYADLFIVDVANPYQPEILSITPIRDLDSNGLSNVNEIALIGAEAFIAAGTDGIQVYDVTDPAAPVFDRSADQGRAYYTGITAHGNVLYATCINHEIDSSEDVYHGVVIYDPETLAAVRELTQADFPGAENEYYQYPMGCRAITHTVEQYGSTYTVLRLYVMDSQRGLHVYNNYYPDDPEYLYTLDTPGYPQDVGFDGTFLYVADSTAGIQLCEPKENNPTVYEINRAITIATPGSAYGVAAVDGYAFAGASSAGIHHIDMNIPAPEVKASYRAAEYRTSDASNGFDSLAISGPYAYVSNYRDLVVLDNTDPESPALRSLQPEGLGSIWEIGVSGSTLFLKENSSIALYDISAPLNPQRLGSINTDDSALTITARGEFAYVGGSKGLYIYNISDPAQTKLVRFLEMPQVRSVAFSGDYAYLYGGGGMSIVNVSKPAYASVLSMHMYRYSENSATRIRVSGDWAYACDSYDGFYAFDISDPEDIPSPGDAFEDGSINGCSYADAFPLGMWAVMFKYDGALQLYRSANPAESRYVRTLAPPVPNGAAIFTSPDYTSGAVNGKTLISLDIEGLKIFSLHD